MKNETTKILNDVQNKNTVAWNRLCEYVEKVAREQTEEFSPLEALGPELFADIYTLPETISKLKHVKKIWLYGSKIQRLPPEIGEMESLEYLDVYTSYNLHWFPFELTYCNNLKDSRVSTRALYGNYKNRMNFPDLANNPVRYTGDTCYCSVCRKEISYSQTNQLWITLKVSTDIVPLLANLCSEECATKLPFPPKDYIPYPHKGGKGLQQPGYDEQEYMDRNCRKVTLEELEAAQKETGTGQMGFLKLIKKIWEK